jgi:hypothetical protein
MSQAASNSTSATVVRLPGRKPASRYSQEKQSRRERAASRQQAFGAAALGFVAVALTALSLTHLAHGIAIVTGCPVWEAWAMAIGVDLGFVALELARLTARERTMKVVGRHIMRGAVYEHGASTKRPATCGGPLLRLIVKGYIADKMAEDD